MSLLDNPNLDGMLNYDPNENNYNSMTDPLPNKGAKSKLKNMTGISQGSMTSEKSMGFNNHKNSLLEESISNNSVVNM